MRNYLIIILIVFILCVNSCSKSSSNIEDYLNTGTTIDSLSIEMMPTLDSLPEYNNIEYRYTHKTMYLFQSDSVALVVYYDDKTYKNEKDKLDETYNLLGKDIIPESEFAINSYTFKFVAEEGKYVTQFPKSFGMIGISDEKKSIAYLYFYDSDLDYIEDMDMFVKRYFKYDF